MNQLGRCSFCKHELFYHSGYCKAPGCKCKAFVPPGQPAQSSQQMRDVHNEMMTQVAQAQPGHRFIGRWVINYAWVAHIEDHGDGTCTLIEYDRSKTPVPFEQGEILETKDGQRFIEAIVSSKDGKILKVRNSKHVFSYTRVE